MAFPASQNLLSEKLERVFLLARSTKQYAAEMSAFLSANSVSAMQILDVMENFQAAINEWNDIIADADSRAYIREQLKNDTFDVVAEFTAMRDAVQGVITWIETNFPKDADGWIQIIKIVNGQRQIRSFAPANTAGLRTQLDAVVAGIS